MMNKELVTADMVHREDFMEVNNMKATREALEFIKLASDDYETYGTTKAGALDLIYEKACAALSIPARNCDVGTVAEQYKRFRSVCDSKDARQCSYCELRGLDGLNCSRDKCLARWMQLPYKEEDAE